MCERIGKNTLEKVLPDINCEDKSKIMSSLKQRMNDPGYKNWMKSGQALNLLNEILQPITDQKMTEFHDDLKEKNKGLGNCMSDCKSKNEPPESCQVCTQWKSCILDKHRNKKMIYWTNVDPKRWPTDKWEVAKTYMPRGQKPGSYDLDISSILNLMSTCKVFQPDTKQKPSWIEKVINVRNAVMHSKDMKVSNDKLKEYLQTIINMFEKLKALQKNASNDVIERNMKHVKKLECYEFNVYDAVDGDEAQSLSSKPNPDQEIKIDVEKLENDLLSQRFTELEHRLDNIEEQLSSQEKTDLKRQFENFLNNNPDLKEEFQDKLTEIFETRLANVEGQVSDLCNRLDSVEKNPAKSKGSGQQVLYKNHLQQYCQKNYLRPPEYQQLFHPKGHGCVVKVDGKEFTTDPNDPSTKSVDSEQKAAKKALEYFGVLRENTEDTGTTASSMAHQPEKHVTAVKNEKQIVIDKVEAKECFNTWERGSILNGKTPVQFLKEYCDKHLNYKNLRYVDKGVQSPFSATLTLEVNGVDKSFEGEVGSSKKVAKQNAAWKAIQNIQGCALEEETFSSGNVPVSKKAKVELSGSMQSTADILSSNPHLPVASDTGSLPSTVINQEPAAATSNAEPGEVSLTSSAKDSSSTVRTVTSKDEEPCDTESIPPAACSSVLSSAVAVSSGVEAVMAKSSGFVASDTRPVQSNAESKSGTASTNEPGIVSNVDNIYKNKLQDIVQRQGEKSKPDYSNTVETNYSGKKYFKGVVEFKYKYEISSNGNFKNKKEAEKQASRQALEKLDSNKKDDENPKGKLLELIPRGALSCEFHENDSYSCKLVLALSLKIETEKLTENKKNAQQLAAKEALEKIQDDTIFNVKYFDFKK